MHTLKNGDKISKIINLLISNNTEITVQIDDEKAEFTTKIIKINQDKLSSSISKKASIIIEKLYPEKGNELIQSKSGVSLNFIIQGKSCKCSVDYLGISSTPPFFGFFLGIPSTIEYEEQRSAKRIDYEIPDFVSAEFSFGKKEKDGKLYELNVMNCSNYGLGLILTKNDFDLLEKLKVGDHINDMSFFASWSMVKVSGIVKHITKIDKGPYENHQLVGLMILEK